MTKLVVRHAFSTANDRDQYGTPAFGNPESPLMPQGIEQAIELGKKLTTLYGLDLNIEPVAVSMMRRTQETAIVAGFRWLHIYPELNEEKGGLSDNDVRLALQEKHSPDATRKAALHIIAHPPEESVLILHAFVIATMCQELDVYQDARFTPRFCEIRELPI